MDNKDKIHYSDGDIALLTDINDLSEFNGIKGQRQKSVAEVNQISVIHGT